MEFKTLIITFSQTGYTRKTAEQIRDGHKQRERALQAEKKRKA